jgi:hypothetical protein
VGPKTTAYGKNRVKTVSPPPSMPDRALPLRAGSGTHVGRRPGWRLEPIGVRPRPNRRNPGDPPPTGTPPSGTGWLDGHGLVLEGISFPQPMRRLQVELAEGFEPGEESGALWMPVSFSRLSGWCVA